MARRDGTLRAHAEILAGSEFGMSDDEHDPEGQTIAFEREQLTALHADAEQRITEIDSALGHLLDATYGRCEHCGAPISDARLQARPWATTCARCAAGGRARR